MPWLHLSRSRRKASGDLALALFFYSGIALGVVLVSLGGGLNASLLTYLFGQPLTVNDSELVVILTLGFVIVLSMLALRRVLFAVVTDEDWSRVSGLPVGFVNNVLAVLTAVAVVAAMRIVGILLIAAMMVLPVASGQILARSFRSTLRWSIAVSVSSVIAGLAASRIWGTAPEAHVLIAAAVFAVVSVTRRSVVSRLPATEEADHDGGRAERSPRDDRDAAAGCGSAIHAEASGPCRHAAARALVSMTDVVSGRSAPPQSSPIGTSRSLSMRAWCGADHRGEFARFELTEELTEHHHHLICSRCGRVEDVTVPSDLEDARPDARSAREARRVRGRRSSPDLDRDCADCARRG